MQANRTPSVLGTASAISSRAAAQRQAYNEKVTTKSETIEQIRRSSPTNLRNLQGWRTAFEQGR
jgi:hypothetical protein